MIRKLLKYGWDNILFLETLFLLAFIPLYPKIPVLDVRNTWVYIRAEDFIIFFVIFSWLILLVKEKVTLKTPITVPILVFWAIGTIATIHGVLIIFPEIANVFPNVAFLSLLRHIEYISLFFIAFAGIKNKKQLNIVIATLFATLIGVILYGFGQKYLSFPAYLTSNEEFAKGIPITLSELSRIPSTFAGHYDLAAYLVLMISIMVSLAFGFKNWVIKIGLIFASLLGFVLLFMTVSRVSFVALLAALFVVFLFQKRKLILLSIPLAIIFVAFVLTTQSSLIDRFSSTVSEVDVVVDAKTGESLGHVRFEDREYFNDKLVLQRRVKDVAALNKAIKELEQDSDYYASTSALLPSRLIPKEVPVVSAVNVSTGENLTQGTGYVNLYLSPVTKRIPNFFYELPSDVKASPSADALVLNGDFIVKRASAYDLSFTTRFQGEWPNAIEAFKRNLLVGSGYGSVSLAIDNNYLRILGEIGILGFISFFLIFLSLAIYIRKVYPDIDSKVARSFIIGFGAGTIGLLLNAVLIDVFEASKVAFVFWILMGIIFAILRLYQKKDFNLWKELMDIASSKIAIIFYLLIGAIALYAPSLNNYFVADDFTWLRWAADCGNCNASTLISYFTNSDGFFYRPGTKVLFYGLYQTAWLNQVVYHLLSLFLHFAVASLLYLLARRIFKNNALGSLTAFLFLILSGSAEAVLWISSIGNLIVAALGLLGLFLFIFWEEKKKIIFYIGAFVSFSLALLFQELAVILPLLIPVYLLTKDSSIKSIKNSLLRNDFLFLFIPVFIYLVIRFLSESHWHGGDYNYNLILLPFNFVGNLLGYVLLTVIGPLSLSINEGLRVFMRENIFIALLMIPVILVLIYLAYKLIYKNLQIDEKRIVNFGFAFFFVGLLPYLGLGNITSRYDYFASIGLIFIFVLMIKKLYEYFLKSGKEIAIVSISVIVGVFVLFHIIQVQQSYFEWREAGSKAKNFFIGIDGAYEAYWSNPNIEFHIVNVPAKFGDAWVFPVGINDAIWFAFKNPDATIYTYNNLDDALSAAGLYRSRVVLVFGDDGRVKAIDRFKGVPRDLIKP